METTESADPFFYIYVPGDDVPVAARFYALHAVYLAALWGYEDGIDYIVKKG